MIECRGLSKGFGDEGVSGLTLKVETGQALGLVGPSGAGKSVTLRMLMGLVRPDAGSAAIFGMDCFTRRKAVQRRVAFAPASPVIEPGARGEDWLRFTRRYLGGFNPQKARAFEERMGFTPVGLVRQMGDGGRKALGLMAAFSLDRDALLLDEPFQGLDAMKKSALAGLIRDELSYGRAILMTSHVLDEARRVATHVAIIRKGQVVVNQPAESLRQVRQKVYHVTFASAGEAASFAREWEAAVELIGPRALVAVPGSPQVLIRTLARYEVADLTGGREESEEGFLRFHGDELT